MTQHMGRGDLDGRRALVTGGASGIGKGTARRRRSRRVGPGGRDERTIRHRLPQRGPIEFDPVYGLTKHAVVGRAQWVIWPGVDVASYEWNPAIRLTEATP